MYESIPYVDDERFQLKNLEVEPLKVTENKELLSYTGHILLYEFCPLKYRFIKDFKFKALSNPKTYYGIFVHKVIERIHKEFLSGIFQRESLKELIENIGSSLEKNLRTDFSEEIREKVKVEVERYLNRNNLESIISTEVKNYSVEKDYIIEGTLDLLRKTSNGVELIDFKTGAYDKARVEIYKRQLEIYTYLLKERYTLDEIKAYLYYIEEENSLVEIELDEKSIDRTIKRFDYVAERLISGDFNPREYGEKCGECEFKWYCMPKEEKVETKL